MPIILSGSHEHCTHDFHSAKNGWSLETGSVPEGVRTGHNYGGDSCNKCDLTNVFECSNGYDSKWSAHLEDRFYAWDYLTREYVKCQSK